jgi:hypothetical protein
MGGSFFFFAMILLGLFLLFVPISLKMIAHYDMNRKKFCFVIYLFSFLKIIGGYIATYKGGFAVHISKKKAILLPYSQVNKERKRFSFMHTFRLHALDITTETGAEYLLPLVWVHAILRTYFFAKGGNKSNIENNLWLLDGDVLRISASLIMKFTMFIILKNILIFMKEKLKELWRKNMKKSTI